jgi:hypothetical protein
MKADEIDDHMLDRGRKDRNTSKKKRKTLGQHAYEILSKPDEPVLVLDVAASMQRSMLHNLEAAIKEGVRKFGGLFYIQLIMRKEFFFGTAIRNYWVVRRSRPDPEWDISLWSYDTKEEKLLFHYSLPERHVADMMLAHPENVVKDEQQLFSYIKQFAAGQLV